MCPLGPLGRAGAPQGRVQFPLDIFQARIIRVLPVEFTPILFGSLQVVGSLKVHDNQVEDGRLMVRI